MEKPVSTVDKIKNWTKEHKKGLIIAGTALGVAGIGVLVFFGFKNKEELEAATEQLEKLANTTSEMAEMVSQVKIPEETCTITVESVISNKHAPHPVDGHIRNLPEGHVASAEKIAEAIERGILLKEGQTIVDAYETGKTVA